MSEGLDEQALRRLIRDVPDFPQPGVVFKDLTPLLADGRALQAVTRDLAAFGRAVRTEVVVGIEARGFALASPVAVELGVGFVPVRKPGKLPAATVRRSYELEYGLDALEVHADALHAGARVLVVDDVLATGGTAEAACELVEEVGGIVAGVAVLVELSFLEGRARLANRDLHVAVCY